MIARITRHRMFWPLLVLLALLVSNLAFTPDFFSIRMQDGHLYGSLIDILHFGSPLIMVSLGMTLVIATGGIDLSVGSVVAIGGALACLVISEQTDQTAMGGVVLAVTAGLLVATALGLANGLLVTRVGLQPIIATLILMVAGRGVAQLITNGQIITVNSPAYKVIGGGYRFTMPTSILIVVAVVGLTMFAVRRTALGLLLESVGGNAEASRLVGIRAKGIITTTYVFAGLCAGIAGIMISSNVSSADGNNAGLWIELDAILAVVIGGTALTGGRFSLTGTVIGALIIQTLSTTIYTIGVPPETTLVVKAIVVMTVCLVQSPAFRARVFRRRSGPEPAPDRRSAGGPAPAAVDAPTATAHEPVGGTQ